LLRRLLAGESGISQIDRFDAKEFPTRFGGQIKNFDIEGYVREGHAAACVLEAPWQLLWRNV
jgi:3-oxoacyl-(acyl-carrier-protein) synthase